MRKIAASLNEQNEQDAFILAYLPDDNVSSVIKDALQLYFQVELGELQITQHDEEIEASKASGGGLDSEVVGMLLSTMQRIADGIDDQTRALNNLRVVGAVAPAQPAETALAPQGGNGEDEERLDPEDPLVKNFLGISDEFANFEFNREQ